MSTTTPPAPAAAKKTAAKKATAKKAPAKKTTAPAKPPAKKAAAPARPAKKTVPAQRTGAKPAAKKSPAKKKTKKKAPAKNIGARAIHAARFAWEHPFLALVGTTAVAGTVLYRGVLRPTGKVIAFTGRAGLAVGSWAWDTGRAYVIRRRRSARPLTTGKHANCRRCKGTGTLPRHDAHGRFLGSISCTG